MLTVLNLGLMYCYPNTLKRNLIVLLLKCNTFKVCSTNFRFPALIIILQIGCDLKLKKLLPNLLDKL